jgi:hypothetical protein
MLMSLIWRASPSPRAFDRRGLISNAVSQACGDCRYKRAPAALVIPIRDQSHEITPRSLAHGEGKLLPPERPQVDHPCSEKKMLVPGSHQPSAATNHGVQITGWPVLVLCRQGLQGLPRSDLTREKVSVGRQLPSHLQQTRMPLIRLLQGCH